MMTDPTSSLRLRRWESLAKRLLAANQNGLYVKQADGHRWIVSGCPPWEACDDSCELMECPVLSALRDKGVSINSKVYGSVVEALDIIDLALKKVGYASLMETYECMFGQDAQDVFQPSGDIEDCITAVHAGEGGLQ